MATSITFNDGAAATLNNGKNVPGDRFAGWTPRQVPVGEASNPQASPTRTMFRFRTDWCSRFSLPMIPSAGSGSLLTIATRLVAHLNNGGSCTVNTGDAASSSYTMVAAPGVTIEEPRLTDRALMEYTLDLDLASTGGAIPVCRYDG